MAILIAVGCLAVGFLLQSVLGFWQIKNFNERYRAMREEGQVAIGRSKGILRTGVILMLLVDRKGNIIRAERMQGMTIFARFKEIAALAEQPLFFMDKPVEEKLDPFTKKALHDARHVYRVVKAGGEVKTPKAPLAKVLSVFTRKREVNG
ncbi:glucitol operon activator protein [Bacillus sp. JCM 19046]|uniref:DNA-binding transcriptional regulator of glucitol operon n=1 Tax=Shouchella xiaoxiensis TaxID=766895 RepID=A0ABS2SW00_9BACI|nr:transcriptional regulator GutM [Shouchella xiaoxiensis]MBM7839669.1 DNA-binding transcriptional regulator of glucitol operon [Shouchella xiaoxiensis]GAF13197.1 glucitol operon activator protein [Bacillus sp. JCM 19045]GAF16379.1 glucitol operon activator protein [Bacillus sp. JCM 19046]